MSCHTYGKHNEAAIPACLGDNGVSDPPASVQLNLPSEVAVDDDRLYVVDSGNKRVGSVR